MVVVVVVVGLTILLLLLTVEVSLCGWGEAGGVGEGFCSFPRFGSCDEVLRDELEGIV